MSRCRARASWRSWRSTWPGDSSFQAPPSWTKRRTTGAALWLCGIVARARLLARDSAAGWLAAAIVGVWAVGAFSVLRPGSWAAAPALTAGLGGGVVLT